jgi:hypothetical protein
MLDTISSMQPSKAFESRFLTFATINLPVEAEYLAIGLSPFLHVWGKGVGGIGVKRKSRSDKTRREEHNIA